MECSYYIHHDTFAKLTKSLQVANTSQNSEELPKTKPKTNPRSYTDRPSYGILSEVIVNLKPKPRGCTYKNWYGILSGVVSNQSQEDTQKETGMEFPV